jgi:uncharacterized protein YjiK
MASAWKGVDRLGESGRPVGLGLVAALAALALLVGLRPAAAPAAPPTLTGVDLSAYHLVGRYGLPEPTRTTAPPNSLLAQEASSVTYDWDTDTLFVVGDGGTSVVQVSKTGQLIDSMTLAPGNSPQGTTFYDTEGITYVGGGKFVITEERYRQVDLFTYAPGTTLTRADAQTVDLGTDIGNTGLEGISYDPQTSTPGGLPGFIVVKEIDPKGIFQTNLDFPHGTATNGSSTTDEAANLFDPALVPTDDFSDVFALSNLPNLTGSDSSHLLIISQQSGKIVNVDRSGNVESSLTITDAGAPLSVPDETHEGVTIDRDGNIYTVCENGGGDSNHPQLWVYSTTAKPAPRVAITEVDPAGSGAPYAADWFELTNTGSTDLDVTGWRIDDSSNAFATSVPLHLTGTSQILPAGKSAVFLDDSTGTDATIEAAFSQAWFGSTTPPAGLIVGFYGGSGVGLSTSGDGVDVFDSAGDYLTGVSFGTAPTSATFDNSARLGNITGPATIAEAATNAVNGAFVAPDGETGSPGGIPSGGSTSPPPAGSIVITEVAPWGSGNTPYAADWFELTNNGTSAVDLSGWKMDDNSNSAGSAVPLLGVSSLPTGKSAVFFEDTNGTDATIQAAFAQAWFSLNALPAGFLIGHYGGSGVGLSTGGDAVNVFDASDNRVTGVAFGGSPSSAPFPTFDNSAGVGSTSLPLPVISTLSAVGLNGAFLSVDGQELGSPGSAPAPAPVVPPVRITEVAPWGSGNTRYAADWFELTNTGSTAVDLTGWKMDDNSNAFANAVPLLGVSSLPAGKSAVFFEDTSGDDATIEAAFAQAWFGSATLPAGFPIGHYGGSGVGLSTSGDAVNVFDAAADRVTGVSFGASPSAAPFPTFDNTAGAGATTLPLPTISTLSAVGVNGAFLSADGQEIGSPAGATPPPPTTTVAVTEVAPWGSGDSPYAADWFELTNAGSTAVDLTGWRMDDNSNAFANAVALHGVPSLAPGQSAVFVEDTSATDATLATAFAQAWFGSSALPAGFQLGFYGGSGVGLGTSGDAVNVFDAAGNRVTGVSFGASTTDVTFDNTARIGGTTLPLPTISTLSVEGVNGAFASAAAPTEIGSPGTIAPHAIVSEVAPWGSGSTPHAADWFEVTNTGALPLDLTGWKMDDNSDSFGSAVAIHGVTAIPAGKSAVFFEDTSGSDATILSAFSTAWTGSATPPPGLLAGFYGGAGVGLSSGGDAVNLFDPAGDAITGVTFGASPSAAPFATFDNAGGGTSVSTLSTVGHGGAFVSHDDQEIGSPYPANDTTPPTIAAHPSPAANANGWNNTDVAVSWTCTDAGVGVYLPLSSLSEDLLTASGTASATCVDRAGNSATASYTAKIDRVAPTVAFAGSAGTYGVLDTVAITCTAADALSGLASSTCPNASGPAWSFGPGAHTLSATATDLAGNTATASTTFAVVATAPTLTALTEQLVEGSAAYRALNRGAKAGVDARVTTACKFLSKPILVGRYSAMIQDLASDGYLTSGQAAILSSFANAL